MLSDDKRADMLARIGPALAMTLAETTRQGWIFVPQDARDFAILSRREDGMQIGMLPGWFEHGVRFEFAPFIRIDSVAHTLTSLGFVPAGARTLRLHVTMTRGVDALAADVLRRVIGPYESVFGAVRARIREAGAALGAQRQVAETLATLTGAALERRGDDIKLSLHVAGLRLPVRVSRCGDIELGQTNVTQEQITAIVAGLRRPNRLRQRSPEAV